MYHTKIGPAARHQSGFVLITGVVVLLLVTMVALASMRITGMQERITANQRNKTVSLMAAEAGASLALKAFDSAVTPKWWDTLPSAVPALVTASGMSDSRGYWKLANTNELTQSKAMAQNVEILGYAMDDSGNALSETTIVFQIHGQLGLLSHETIKVSGSANITGNAHSNDDFTVSSNGSQNAIANGKVTAHDDVSFSGANVPSAAKQSNAALRDLSAEVGRVGDEKNYGRVFDNAVFSSCNNLGPDLKGEVFYCNGDLVLSGNTTNGTIFVKGNVESSGDLSRLTLVVDGSFTQKGAANWGVSSSTSVSIASTGNININGGGNFNMYGSLWADGDVVRNGGGQAVVRGAGIVSFGSQTWNGNLTYVGVGTGARMVTQWREVN
jgi:PilX N-terminal